MGLLAKGSLVRNKIILLAGDILAGLTALAPVFRMEPLPMWTFLFIPTVLLFSFLCEVYQPERWTIRERMVRSSLALSFSFFLLFFLPGSRASGFLDILICLILFFVLQNTW